MALSEWRSKSTGRTACQVLLSLWRLADRAARSAEPAVAADVCARSTVSFHVERSENDLIVSVLQLSVSKSMSSTLSNGSITKSPIAALAAQTDLKVPTYAPCRFFVMYSCEFISFLKNVFRIG